MKRMNSRLIFIVILSITFAVVKCGEKKKDGVAEEICGQGQGDSKPDSMKEKKEETEAEENKDDKKEKKFFFSGDMRITEKQKEELDRARKTGYKRDATKRSNAKWPNGTVYYEIDGRLGKEAQDAIQGAIRDIEEYTCITFVKRVDKSIEHFVKFIKDQGCWSYVGMLPSNALKQGYKQELSLGRGCEYKGTAIHEIFHALGFEHEQSRPDRDKYVKINFQNIEESNKYNFDKLQESINFVPYDYNSIMHYPDWAFSKNGKPTIEAVGGKKGAEIGQRDGMTAGDIEQVNKYYECDKGSGSGSGSSGSGSSGSGSSGSGSDKNKSCTKILKRGMSDKNSEKGNNEDSEATKKKGENENNGNSDSKGDSGNKGDNGSNGDSGSNSDKGEKGDSGSSSDKGEKGDSGSSSDKGEKGDSGSSSDKGNSGDSGSNGDNGSSGNKDEKGNEDGKKPKDKKGGKCEAHYNNEQENKARKMARKEELMKQQYENIKRREREEHLANMLKKRKKH